MKTYTTTIKYPATQQKRVATFKATEKIVSDAMLMGAYATRSRLGLGDAYQQFDLFDCVILKSQNYKAIKDAEGHVFLQCWGGFAVN